MSDGSSEPALRQLLERARVLAKRLDADPAAPGLGQDVRDLVDALQPLAIPARRRHGPCHRLMVDCAQAIGDLCLVIKDHASAQRLLGEALQALGGLASDADPVTGLQWAAACCSLAASLNQTGRSAQGLERARDALAWHRARSESEAGCCNQGLARALHLLGQAHGHLGRSQEAVNATREAVTIRRRLVDQGMQTVRPELARSHGNLGLWLSDLGLHAQALLETEQALEQYRLIARERPLAVRQDIARELNNLGTMLSGLGRHEEALRATSEALDLRRELAQRNPVAWRAELASSLHNVGAMLFELERYGEALLKTREAVAMRRELVAEDRRAHLFLLASSLVNEGATLDNLGRNEQALQSTTESMDLFRELHTLDPSAVVEPLAMACCDAAKTLRSLGRPQDALPLAREAVGRYRTLSSQLTLAFDLRLATSLNELASALAATRRQDEALATWREAGAILLGMGPEDPHAWCKQIKLAALGLDQATDLTRFHRPLLVALLERRELAHDAGHARLYQDLQQEVVAFLWPVLERLSESARDEVCDAALAVVGTLHSPDLAAWIAGRTDDWPARAALHAARREVIAADEAYLGLLARRQMAEDVGEHLDAALEHAVRSRAAYRNARAQVAAAMQVGAAFDLPDAAALCGTMRLLAKHERHARHGNRQHALLCLLTIGSDGDARAVGVLMLPGASQTVRLIGLPGLADLAGYFASYRTAGVSDRRVMRQPSRQLMAAAGRSPMAGPQLPAALAGLERRLVRPVVQALRRGAGQAQGRVMLHVCCHGVLQQVPLTALESGLARRGVELAHWPGLPYLRAASEAKPTAAMRHGWLIAHDCAWDVAPLPMAAVEANLLASLVPGRTAAAATRIDQLTGQEEAVVMCGHGQSAAHLMGSLDLAGHTLSLDRIVERQLGPPLALLPLCHAGHTTEDRAGNAFGIAAAFLLGGARVVVASSKAVDDHLIPWFTTLLVWHLTRRSRSAASPEPDAGRSTEVGTGAPSRPDNGMPGLCESAQRALRQFGKGTFPRAYRRWLVAALPSALQSIRPGGSEWQVPASAPQPTSAVLQAAFEAWPWSTEVDVSALFSADAMVGDGTARRLAQTVLLAPDPRAGVLRQRLAELAAFIFVYGAD